MLSSDLAKSHQIRRDLAKSGGDSMDLVEISSEMAGISPDLKNFVGNCSFISSVRFLWVLGRNFILFMGGRRRSKNSSLGSYWNI